LKLFLTTKFLYSKLIDLDFEYKHVGLEIRWQMKRQSVINDNLDFILKICSQKSFPFTFDCQTQSPNVRHLTLKCAVARDEDGIFLDVKKIY